MEGKAQTKKPKKNDKEKIANDFLSPKHIPIGAGQGVALFEA